ncbi:hypothetical protein O206_19995 [Ochrobactrum sp. EGD-AQ16]|nr:hypothetical protein O206_19995 [Ochrobactrum sp. EGD-AQ16]
MGTLRCVVLAFGILVGFVIHGFGCGFIRDPNEGREPPA